MGYSIITDEHGYVQRIYKTGNHRFDVYNLDLSEYDFSGLRLYSYKLVDKEIVFDNEKYESLLEEQTKEEHAVEISYLKTKLNETDYIVARAFEEVMSLENPVTWIVDVIKIMIKYSSKYGTIIQNRKVWRERIKEIE